jgi:hypothetical protein
MASSSNRQEKKTHGTSWVVVHTVVIELGMEVAQGGCSSCMRKGVIRSEGKMVQIWVAVLTDGTWRNFQYPDFLPKTSRSEGICELEITASITAIDYSGNFRRNHTHLSVQVPHGLAT